MATSDGIPVTVICDRGLGVGGGLDLTPRLSPGTLSWSSVVPGGFADCSFEIEGDFRRILKDIPYLSTIRIIGDSGKVLWEGQVEDLSPTLTESSVGVKVTAMGWQSVLKETSVRAIWSKRDMDWQEIPNPNGTVFDGTRIIDNQNLVVATGNFDPTNLSHSGVQVSAAGGVSIPGNHFWGALWTFPIGVSVAIVQITAKVSGTHAGTSALTWLIGVLSPGGSWSAAQTGTTAGSFEFGPPLGGTETAVCLGFYNGSGAAVTWDTTDIAQFYNMRALGVISSEDVVPAGPNYDTGGGFYGDTLIKSLISSYVTELGQGVIESGNDFTIDHLDASVRRTAYDILQEIASYYSREWAVWEGALLDWRTPNLQQQQWVVPISQMTALDLDASVVNSQKQAIVLYTDAASGLTAEQSAASSDRRNPYVLNGRVKDELVDGGTMTANTASQLATILLNDLGFGPVPAAGTVKLMGDTIVQHAQGNAVKAWEIRAGQNVTIPELPMADIFTQDGRGETLFHIVSTAADTSKGEVTLTLDSYGSKRSEVLMARIAAVTKLLGG